MKTLLFLTLLFPSLVFAKTTYENKDKQLEFSIGEEAPVRPNYTPEFGLYYYRTGFSVGSIGNEKGSFSLSAVGTRRYADDFYYGIEYATHYGLEGLQSSTFSGNMGLHLITLRHRIKPYFGGGFGYTSIVDKKSLGRPNANGISLNGEVGLEIFRFGFFSVFQGFKFHYNFLDKDVYGNSSFQELYLQFNLRF